MYRHLFLFPKSADPKRVERFIDQELVPMVKAAAGLRSITTSVDALMGPGARKQPYERVVEAVFDTLENALAVPRSKQAQAMEKTVEELGVLIYLFECRDV